MSLKMGQTFPFLNDQNDIISQTLLLRQVRGRVHGSSVFDTTSFLANGDRHLCELSQEVIAMARCQFHEGKNMNHLDTKSGN